jgi:hypothetical protein
MPATAAKLVQISTESAWGSTAGAATIKVQGITDASLHPIENVEDFPQVGYLGPGPLAQLQAVSGEGSWEMVASYEEFPRILNAFFTAIVQSSGSVAGTSSGAWNYPYVAPVSSTQIVSTYNMEYGTSGAAYRSLGSIGKHINISGEAGSFWRANIDWVSKSIIAASQLSTAPVDRTVNPVRMADTLLFVDPFTTGTIGGTSWPATLISFELDIETNRHLKQFAGSINPADWGDAKYETSLRITAEFNANSKAVVDELLGATGAGVSRQIRLRATQGSSATLKQFDLDFAGIKSEGETLFSDRDGNMTVELMFRGQYSTQLSNYFKSLVVNGSSSTT